jgi:hypothetical protein
MAESCFNLSNGSRVNLPWLPSQAVEGLSARGQLATFKGDGAIGGNAGFREASRIILDLQV